MALLILAALSSRNLNWKASALTAMISSTYAALDEYHQTFTPGRTGTFQDVAIDCLGVVCDLAVWGAFRKISHPDGRPTRPSGK